MLRNGVEFRDLGHYFDRMNTAKLKRDHLRRLAELGCDVSNLIPQRRGLLILEAVPGIGRARRDGGDQFGMALPDSLYINAGVQMEYGRVTPPTREGYLPPTRTFSGDELVLTVAGVRLQLLIRPARRWTRSPSGYLTSAC